MLFRLFSSRTRSATRPTERKTSPPGPRSRPAVEGFEDRVVPAAPVNLGSALAAPAAVSPASLLPIDITSVTLNTVTGALEAVGTIGNTAFTLLGQLSLSGTGTTPILHLEINEIHLDLLGLKVDTSDICLNITATAGPGNLLGNLLTGLLGSPLPTIGGLLGGLSTTQLTTLTGELTGLLNGALGQLFSPTSVTGGSVTQSTGSTSILHLELGPINLSLLGLNVSVDDCDDPAGPVILDITAQAGPGKLLGNLLTSVTHLLDGPGNGNGLVNALTRVANRIGDILNRV